MEISIQDIQQQADTKVDAVMYHLGRLINAIDSLDHLINQAHGVNQDPTKRPFYISRKYQWPLIHGKGLKSWQDQFNRTFGKG